MRFGKILYLSDDQEELRQQLDGVSLSYDPQRRLIDAISTDEITPAWTCFHIDEALARYSLVGLRGGLIERDTLSSSDFEVLVAGESMGCGSSRETAPFSQLKAGIKLVIARSFEKIYAQNCHNIGLLISDDFDLLPRIEAGEEIDIEVFCRGLDPISAAIVRAGGLFAYNEQRLRGEIRPPLAQHLPLPQGAPRPMTIAQKILAAHAVVDAEADRVGLPYVAPGDALFVRTDLRFSHEYVTPMAASFFHAHLGDDAKVRDPSSVVTFRDHLILLGEVMPEERRAMGLLEQAEGLAVTQKSFAERQGLRLYGEHPDGGAEAICHNAVIDDLALPGDLVIGSDSHSCTAGVVGAFAFGVGSTDMANAWLTKDVRVRVPESLRVRLHGELAANVTAKDVMLHLLSLPFFRTSQGIGKVLEFCGAGLGGLSFGERATLTNMAVEAGGFTGIMEADELLLDALRELRDVERPALEGRLLRSDPDAEYLQTFEIDLANMRPMVALPGNPRNGQPVAELSERVPIDIAYGGSCTGGKLSDLELYARVFRAAVAEGKRVAEGVRCYIQYGSQSIRRVAEQRGYHRLFEEVGAEVLPPSCGACINAGRGASSKESEVTISAQNRNFPGRSGPGAVFLASPLTVAASAIAGYIDASSA